MDKRMMAYRLASTYSVFSKRFPDDLPSWGVHSGAETQSVDLIFAELIAKFGAPHRCRV